MNKIINLSIVIVLVLFFSCKTNQKQVEVLNYKDSINVLSNLNDEEIKITMYKGVSFNYPSFVVWQEDLDGNYIRTIFITQSYAKGIFSHEMVGDTMWLNNSGPSFQPAALPYWTFKKGKIDNLTYVPTSEHPYVDGFSGETPKSDFRFSTVVKNDNDKYRILVEVNQTWDWNKYWTNNKYPDNNAYKHSAQPSVIYSVTVNKDDEVFYLNPIGHGDPKGESGKLYTDLSTLTTAKEIFKQIVIEVN